MLKTSGILGKKLMFVIAHPDDESVLAAGTIWENHKAGGRNFIVCATKGEKGKSHLKKNVSPGQLKKIRKRELEKVSEFLGVDYLKILGLPDTGVREYTKEFGEKVLLLAKKYKPDFIIGFGPDGISGHYDHIAAGQAAMKVASKLKVQFLAFTRPPKLQNGKAKHWFRKRRKHGIYIDNFEYEKPDVHIKIKAAIKQKAISMHRSQIEGDNFFPGIPASAVKELLSLECYVSKKPVK